MWNAGVECGCPLNMCTRMCNTCFPCFKRHLVAAADIFKKLAQNKKMQKTNLELKKKFEHN